MIYQPGYFMQQIIGSPWQTDKTGFSLYIDWVTAGAAVNCTALVISDIDPKTRVLLLCS